MTSEGLPDYTRYLRSLSDEEEAAIRLLLASKDDRSKEPIRRLATAATRNVLFLAQQKNPHAILFIRSIPPIDTYKSELDLQDHVIKWIYTPEGVVNRNIGQLDLAVTNARQALSHLPADQTAMEIKGLLDLLKEKVQTLSEGSAKNSTMLIQLMQFLPEDVHILAYI